MTHELKTWPQYFRKVVTEEKTFEIRENDRDFNVGDILHLKEWRPLGYSTVSPNERIGKYTGNECKVRVTYVLFNSDPLPLMGNTVVMSIKLI